MDWGRRAGTGAASFPRDELLIAMMPHPSTGPLRLKRAGWSLIEVMIAMTLLAVILGVAAMYLHHQASSLVSISRKTAFMQRASIMLDNVAQELRFARGDVPRAWLTQDLAVDEEGFIMLDTTMPFPARGTLLLEPGTAQEERIAYETLDPALERLGTLGRGALCTAPSSHLAGTPVLWALSATAIQDQVAPDPSFFDGIAREMTGQVFYRGDGTGFTYRIPVDPTGGENYFDDDGAIQWGAIVGGNADTDGRACFYFAPVAQVQEAARNVDLNQDGDLVDSFDLGQIRKQVWSATGVGGTTTDVALCPPMVLQEVCAYGADLDNDGFDDPIFLWEPDSSRLRIRLFILDGNANQSSLTRMTEVSFFLRNGLDS